MYICNSLPGDGDTLRMLGHDVFAIIYAGSSWTGFGDDSIAISKIKDEAAMPPATMKISNYIMSYKLTKEEKDTAYVKVAHPAKGHSIQTVRTADGAVTSRKVVR